MLYSLHTEDIDLSIVSTVSEIALSRFGRIENHERIMDGTAAVSADAGDGTKVGHWVPPRRQFPAGGVCSGKRESEDLLWMEETVHG